MFHELAPIFSEVCSFVYLIVYIPIRTQEPLSQFTSNLDWKTQEIIDMFLAWFWDSKLSGYRYFYSKDLDSRYNLPSAG